MAKKGNLFLITLVFLVLIISGTFAVSAADFNLKITGEVNNLTSDLWLKTNANSVDSDDPYDLGTVPDGLGTIAVLSSDVDGVDYSVDSYNGTNPRIYNLSYVAPSKQNGTLSLSWDSSLISSDLVVTFKSYGNDSSYTIQSGEDVVMSTTSSYTVELEDEDSIYVQVIVDDYVAPVIPVDTDTGSSGGGGGSVPSKVSISGTDVFIGDKFVDVYMAVNSIKTKKIELYNQGNGTLTIQLSSRGLEGVFEFMNREDMNFKLGPFEKKTIDYRLISSSFKDKLNGTIIVNSGRSTQEIEMIINVNDKDLWFDAEIAIPWEYKIIEKGSALPVQLSLLPVGLESGFDVSAHYTIFDDKGRLWLDESSDFFIEEAYEDRIDFATQNLPVGKYVLELELVYPEGIAASRSNFEVRGEGQGLPAILGTKFIYLLFGVGALILIIAIILIIRSYKKIKKHKNIRKPRKNNKKKRK